MSLITKTKQPNKFKSTYSLKHRKDESARIKHKYPTRCPIIVQKHDEFDKNIPTIDKSKYLVPGDLSVSQMLYVIRKRMKLSPERALYIFVGVNYTMPPTSALMKDIYKEFKDIDNFLYFYYNTENTFGNCCGGVYR